MVHSNCWLGVIRSVSGVWSFILRGLKIIKRHQWGRTGQYRHTSFCFCNQMWRHRFHLESTGCLKENRESADDGQRTNSCLDDFLVGWMNNWCQNECCGSIVWWQTVKQGCDGWRRGWVKQAVTYLLLITLALSHKHTRTHSDRHVHREFISSQTLTETDSSCLTVSCAVSCCVSTVHCLAYVAECLSTVLFMLF